MRQQELLTPLYCSDVLLLSSLGRVFPPAMLMFNLYFILQLSSGSSTSKESLVPAASGWAACYWLLHCLWRCFLSFVGSTLPITAYNGLPLLCAGKGSCNLSKLCIAAARARKWGAVLGCAALMVSFSLKLLFPQTLQHHFSFSLRKLLSWANRKGKKKKKKVNGQRSFFIWTCCLFFFFSSWISHFFSVTD